MDYEKLLQVSLTLFAQLIAFLREAKANGKLTPEQLDAAVVHYDDDTQAKIRAALAQ